MNKQILIFMPSIEGGGVEKNLFLVTNYLSQKFNKISVVTISKKYKSKFNKSVKIITLSSNLWDNLSRKAKYFLALILLIREIFLDRNTIVFSFQANIYCIFICKLFGIKVISRSNSAPQGWSKNFIKHMLFKFFLKLADKVMVNSVEFRKVIKKQFNVNAVCIYNPLNIDEIIKQSKKKTFKLFRERKKLKILNIGRYVDQKDQITLLKSLTKLRKYIDYEAAIIGKGILKEKLKRFILKNNLKKNVKLYNFTSNPFALLKQADLFILTSKYEGLPNVLLESLVLKKFIISSNCPTGPREILLNGKGGLLFKVGDCAELTKKIIYYNENKKRCQKLLNFAIKNLTRFDYHANLRKYYKLILSVV
jgi:glycosyltransferase involved in cell wall biosynthesis